MYFKAWLLVHTVPAGTEITSGLIMNTITNTIMNKISSHSPSSDLAQAGALVRAHERPLTSVPSATHCVITDFVGSHTLNV